MNIAEVKAELLACFDCVPWWAEPVQEEEYTERSKALLKLALVDHFPDYDRSQIGIVEGPPHGKGVGQWMIVMFPGSLLPWRWVYPTGWYGLGCDALLGILNDNTTPDWLRSTADRSGDKTVEGFEAYSAAVHNFDKAIEYSRPALGFRRTVVASYKPTSVRHCAGTKGGIILLKEARPLFALFQ